MNAISRFFRQHVLDRFPTPLPRGMTAFEVWAKSLIDTYQFPDNASVRFTLAAILLNLGPTDSHKPKRFFGKCGLMAASKEIAHATMTRLKDEQQARAKAEAEAVASNSTEATVTPITSASSAKPQNPA